jgi:hypothetical protein
MGVLSKVAKTAAKKAAEKKAAAKAAKAAASRVTDDARRFVVGAKNTSFPGVYKNPRIIAEEAAARARTTPEDPALKEVFGVSRQDLYDIGQQGRRKGNVSGDQVMAIKPGARGSSTAAGAMNDPNAQRLVDTLTEGGKFPELFTGMDAWYVGDPLYQKLAAEFGPVEAAKAFNNYRSFSGMASPGTAVPDEIIRGGAANTLAGMGRFRDFEKYAGKQGKRGSPLDMLRADIPGHPYHKTAQALPMRNLVRSGEVEMGSPKVPLYINAFGADAPGVRFQTDRPVPDAHFTRGVGVADMRSGKNPGRSMSMAEAQSFGPFFNERVAGPAGLQAVPAQARLWGLFSPQTGVAAESGVGAPKLELIARHIKRLADRDRISTDRALFEHIGPKRSRFATGGPVKKSKFAVKRKGKK